MNHYRSVLRPFAISAIIISLVLSGHGFVRAAAQQAATPVTPPLSIDMQDVPLPQALSQLFRAAKVDYTIPSNLPQTPITLKVNNNDFQTVLKNLLTSADTLTTHFTYTVNSGVYNIEWRTPDLVVVDTEPKQLFQIPLNYIRSETAIGLARTLLATDVVIFPVPNGNGLMIKATESQIAEVRNAVQLSDVQPITTAIRASVVYVTPKGTRSLLVSTMLKTNQDQDASSDQESTGTESYQTARFHFQAASHRQGDGACNVKSIWEISLPLGLLGVAKTNVRLDKRLSTNTLILPHRSVVVGEVSGEQWGGSGTIVLELSADVVSNEPGGRSK